MGESIRERIDAALKQAVKAREKRSTATLRLINAAIQDRDIAARSDGSREGVPDKDVLGVLAKMVKQREESGRIYEQAGRLELAADEREEIEIIRQFLPRQMSDEETRAVCEEIVRELDAKGLKDMGRTMAALKERYAGEIDFAKASATIKELLA